MAIYSGLGSYIDNEESESIICASAYAMIWLNREAQKTHFLNLFLLCLVILWWQIFSRFKNYTFACSHIKC